MESPPLPLILIESTPLSERPRERCLQTGTACLSLRECLALILGSGPPGIGCLGLAHLILTRPGPGMSPSDEERAFFTALELTGMTHLQGFHGLGPSGQAKILAAFELAKRYVFYRMQKSTVQKNTISHLANQALTCISQKLRAEVQEWFGFLPL